MSAPLAIETEGLSKRYHLGGSRSKYGSLRQSVSDVATSLLRRAGTSHARSEIWALKDVSLEVRQGDVLGVIGRNGAGKSTLLKILSQITKPTLGRARVRGRLGSLLEVGTGFHPELTGKENVFLSGAVLGMTRKDIRARFDEIASFAGVESHLDTPVKYYSSGMYMRLAFSVAAHLEPDVLVVDEVLAVGDAEFQKKCLGKMSSVATEGRTIVFVSHDLAAIDGLCTSAILLDRGQIKCSGTPRDVLSAYTSGDLHALADVDLTDAMGRPAGMKPVLTRLRMLNAKAEVSSVVACGHEYTFELGYRHVAPIRTPEFAVRIDNPHGAPLVHIQSQDTDPLTSIIPAEGVVRCRVDSILLVPGTYNVALGCRSGPEQLDLVYDAAAFDVVPWDYFGTGRLPEARNGYLLARAEWSSPVGNPGKSAS